MAFSLVLSCVSSPILIQYQGFKSNCSFQGKKVFACKDLVLTVKAAAKMPAPWLLLPPVVEGKDMFYKFKDFEQDSEKRLKKKRRDGDEVPPDTAKLVGSSYGWLASFDDDTNHVFLSNPISGRHIKLPPISTLPDPETNLLDGRGSESRLILTCSPDQGKDECRAVIIYGSHNWLAYCVPGDKMGEWTPIGEPYYWIQDWDCNELYKYERPYTDFVYSHRHKLLFSIMENLNEFEGWNLTDPLHPKRDWNFTAVDHSISSLLPRLSVEHWAPPYPWSGDHWLDEDQIKHCCYHLHYLVLAPHSDELFHVVRHVAHRLRPDGSVAPRVFFSGKSYPNWGYRYPYKTISFDVYKLDCAREELTYMEGSLEGLAMFVGMSDSFALPAADYPHLKPDSIYFTDEDRLLTPSWTNFGGDRISLILGPDLKAQSSWPLILRARPTELGPWSHPVYLEDQVMKPYLGEEAIQL